MAMDCNRDQGSGASPIFGVFIWLFTFVMFDVFFKGYFSVSAANQLSPLFLFRLNFKRIIGIVITSMTIIEFEGNSDIVGTLSISLIGSISSTSIFLLWWIYRRNKTFVLSIDKNGNQVYKAHLVKAVELGDIINDVAEGNREVTNELKVEILRYNNDERAIHKDAFYLTSLAFLVSLIEIAPFIVLCVNYGPYVECSFIGQLQFSMCFVLLIQSAIDVMQVSRIQPLLLENDADLVELSAYHNINQSHLTVIESIFDKLVNVVKRCIGLKIALKSEVSVFNTKPWEDLRLRACMHIFIIASVLLDAVEVDGESSEEISLEWVSVSSIFLLDRLSDMLPQVCLDHQNNKSLENILRWISEIVLHSIKSEVIREKTKDLLTTWDKYQDSMSDQTHGVWTARRVFHFHQSFIHGESSTLVDPLLHHIKVEIDSMVPPKEMYLIDDTISTRNWIQEELLSKTSTFGEDDSGHMEEVHISGHGNVQVSKTPSHSQKINIADLKFGIELMTYIPRRLFKKERAEDDDNDDDKSLQKDIKLELKTTVQDHQNQNYDINSGSKDNEKVDNLLEKKQRHDEHHEKKEIHRKGLKKRLNLLRKLVKSGTMETRIAEREREREKAVKAVSDKDGEVVNEDENLDDGGKSILDIIEMEDDVKKSPFSAEYHLAQIVKKVVDSADKDHVQESFADKYLTCEFVRHMFEKYFIPVGICAAYIVVFMNSAKNINQGSAAMEKNTILTLPAHYDLDNEPIQKVLIPMVYGIMHCNLLTWALLPLTMTRRLICKLGEYYYISRFLHLEMWYEWHRMLGYLLIFGIFISALLWWIAIASSCADRNISCSAFYPSGTYIDIRPVEIGGNAGSVLFLRELVIISLSILTLSTTFKYGIASQSQDKYAQSRQKMSQKIRQRSHSIKIVQKYDRDKAVVPQEEFVSSKERVVEDDYDYWWAHVTEWWSWDENVDDMDKSWFRKVHEYFDEHSFEVFYYGHLYPAVIITAFAFFSRFQVFVFSAPCWFMWFLGVLIDRFYFTIEYKDLPGIGSTDSTNPSKSAASMIGAAAHGILGAGILGNHSVDVHENQDAEKGKSQDGLGGFVQLDNSSPEGVILLALPNPIVAESRNGIDPPRRQFHYEAGQVAFLNCPMLGKLVNRNGDRDKVLGSEWHPFSIASSPNQSTLQFIIGPQKEHSWTARLKEAIHHRFQVTASGKSKLKRIPLKVMGPFGGSFTKADQFDCLCLFGGGTGLTNSLSVLRRIVLDRKDEMAGRIALYNTILEKNGKVFGKNLPWMLEELAEEEIPLSYVKEEGIKKKVFLVWSTSDVHALVWSFERLGEILCSKDHMGESDIVNLNKWLNVKIFCSRAKTEKEKALFNNLKADKLFPNNYLGQGLKLQSLRSQAVIQEIFTDIKRQTLAFTQNNPECNSNLKMFFCGPNAMRLNILKFLEKQNDKTWSIEANTENFG